MTDIITVTKTGRTTARISLDGVNGTCSQQALKTKLQTAESLYASKNPGSKAAHNVALESMPGGNTRSVLYNQPFPICIKRGQGNRLWDVDGHEYLDFMGEMTAGLYGHSNGTIREALISAFDQLGVNLGAHNLEEAKLASLLCSRFQSIEHIRFCNSGTEANLYALSVARKVTGKRKVIAFTGGYHGGVLGFAHGVSENTVDPGDWVLGSYNDQANLSSLFESHDDIAAVIVEAMQGAGGSIPGDLGFLQSIQSLSAKHRVIFILDEVMTSRLYPSGLQGKFGLHPDLTTLGKYMGGGLAFGAFGGRKELLQTYDPRQSSALPHSGTFNNSTLTMAAGYAGLSKVYTIQANLELNALGESLRTKLQTIAKGTKMVITGVGAVMTVHFLEHGRTPLRVEDLDHHSIPELKKLFWFWCIEMSYWIAERGMISLSLGTTMKDVDVFVKLVDDFIAEHRADLKLENSA
ncbi:glutamate-1-semialdehyde 2,1-aminomutase [Capronia coronata CBS 617.96]|uniref:Glutamate-1-semialdehyde 2,1-aminomutase n=1 Tax=Capronia coronata CBS 617.96 TaxID=1182541 RepID=W9XZL9_9EURO|nr:glutamate-1-semialdehyde 2,1-aminomutase [Capronia coronata CBS 617.96]EXJ85987.1 glutamate-1-semialdehyde 2,1-aminomutase [Capronia coronata CBS 617.96]